MAMQKRYSEEFKEAIIQKMMPPNPQSVSQLCRETGVSDVTLYKWRKDFRNRGGIIPVGGSKFSKWSAEDKLGVVIETSSFNEIELAEYCRSKGLYPEQVEQWKTDALTGYKNSDQEKKERQRLQKEDKKKIKNLERELKRKEKALAETAALLVLSKKCEAIWGKDEED